MAIKQDRYQDSLIDTGPVHTGPVFIDTDELPWVPFPGVGGSSFKLLRVDERNGGVTLLLRIPAGVYGPVHRHFAGGEYLVLSGHVVNASSSTKIGPGGYAYDPKGYTHQEPPYEEEVVFFINSYGPQQVFTEDGKPGPIVSMDTLIRYWNKHLRELAAQEKPSTPHE